MILNYCKPILGIIIGLLAIQIACSHALIIPKNIQLSDTTFTTQWAIVTLSSINIRKTPNQQSELISQSMMGMPVKILNRKKKWFYIQTIDGYKGWTNYYALKIFEHKQQFINFWNNSSFSIFTDYFGIVRSLPNLHSEVTSDIVFNNLVKVNRKVSNFYEIALPNGRKGYIEKQKLENWKNWVNKRQYNPNELTKIAQKFLGFPYAWGGASIKGIDCSSFMQLIFFQQGIVLPRDAKLQIELGNEIDTTKNFNHLMLGDLLFFGKKEITHVAMYIGHQKYIHCFGEVKINSLDSTAIDYNKMLRNMLVKVKRLEENNISHLKLVSSLYTFLER